MLPSLLEHVPFPQPAANSSQALQELNARGDIAGPAPLGLGRHYSSLGTEGAVRVLGTKPPRTNSTLSILSIHG